MAKANVHNSLDVDKISRKPGNAIIRPTIDIKHMWLNGRQT